MAIDQVPRIERFAPTTINNLSSCMYRVALQRAGRLPRRPSVFTALGLVAHKMMERFWKGGFRGLADEELDVALRSTWDDLVAEQQQAVDAAYPGGMPPRAVDWPGYSVTKSRTVRSIKRLAGDRQDAPGGQRVSPELELSDDLTGLYGQLDRLEVNGSAVTVIDLKSGLWQHEVTTQQRRQLMLYAWLVHSSRGVWPSEVAIESAAGQRTKVDVDPEAIEQAVAEARGLVAEYNQHAAAGWPALEATARPDETTCKWCPMRLVCDPYWVSLNTEWGHAGSVRGAVAGIEEGAAGWSVILTTESPHDRADDATAVYQLRGPQPVDGTLLAVVNADERGVGALRCRWDTQALWHADGGSVGML